MLLEFSPGSRPPQAHQGIPYLHVELFLKPHLVRSSLEGVWKGWARAARVCQSRGCFLEGRSCWRTPPSPTSRPGLSIAHTPGATRASLYLLAFPCWARGHCKDTRSFSHLGEGSLCMYVCKYIYMIEIYFYSEILLEKNSTRKSRCYWFTLECPERWVMSPW